MKASRLVVAALAGALVLPLGRTAQAQGTALPTGTHFQGVDLSIENPMAPRNGNNTIPAPNAPPIMAVKTPAEILPASRTAFSTSCLMGTFSLTAAW